MPRTNPPPLLNVRAALILLIAALAGIAAGVLTYLSGHDPAAALLAGGGSIAATTGLLHTVID